MNYIIFICSVILPIFSVKVTKPKLCINCKYFIPSTIDDKFGKCALFPSKQEKMNYLVSGITTTDYYHCSVLREFDHMCGEEGKMFKKKIKK